MQTFFLHMQSKNANEVQLEKLVEAPSLSYRSFCQSAGPEQVKASTEYVSYNIIRGMQSVTLLEFEKKVNTLPFYRNLMNEFFFIKTLLSFLSWTLFWLV